MQTPSYPHKWQVPKHWTRIETLDMHTGGEPLRIFTSGLPEIPGDTILEKRQYFKEHHDHIRTSCMWEPRGHADMYGAVITGAVSKGADFGAFFMHNEGYSTMCGHAIIALARMACETGLVDKDKKELVIDVPAGIIRAKAHFAGGKFQNASFLNVPSFTFMKDQAVQVDGIGTVHFDIAFGGAFYALVDSRELGLKLIPGEHVRLVDWGRRIKETIALSQKISHPLEEELGFLYGTIFTGDPFEAKNHSRNVCIFANGQLDRSATGTGVSARAAALHEHGELKINQKINIESILGTTMDVEIKENIDYGPYNAVIPEVTGTAFYTGRSIFYLDPDDPLKNGFIFR